MTATTLKVAIEGCCHGELNKIYSELSKKTDLLIICGDFQAIRNETDLQTMNVPDKFKKLGDFHEYYKGIKKAPVPTIFIGGNHECSSYLQELKFGGWVAPNIYYLGEFGSIWFRGLQISGTSGIFNQYSFCRNYIDDEHLPYTDSSIRSVYHMKPKTFLKMYAMNHNVDIGLSHDWPAQIEQHGDVQRLLKKKHFFKTDIRNGTLGSPLNKFLLSYLRPRYWFSGHLHARFEAKVKYDKRASAKARNNPDEITIDMNGPTQKTDEIELDMDEMEPSKKKKKLDWESSLLQEEASSGLVPDRVSSSQDSTYFLALDKCLPKRRFLEVVDIAVKPENTNHASFNDTDNTFYYSKRAIAINKVIEEYLQSHKKQFSGINMNDVINDPRRLTILNELLPMIGSHLQQLNSMDDDNFIIPENFEVVAPTSDESEVPLQYWPNNQTKQYCDKFGIIDSTPK